MRCEICQELGAAKVTFQDKDQLCAHGKIHELQIEIIDGPWEDDDGENNEVVEDEEQFLDTGDAAGDTTSAPTDSIVLGNEHIGYLSGPKLEKQLSGLEFDNYYRALIAKVRCSKNQKSIQCGSCKEQLYAGRGPWMETALNHVFLQHAQVLLKCGYCDYTSAGPFNLKQHSLLSHRVLKTVGDYIHESGMEQETILELISDCFTSTAQNDDPKEKADVTFLRSAKEKKLQESVRKRKTAADKDVPEQKRRTFPPFQMVMRSSARGSNYIIEANVTVQDNKKDDFRSNIREHNQGIETKLAMEARVGQMKNASGVAARLDVKPRRSAASKKLAANVNEGTGRGRVKLPSIREFRSQIKKKLARDNMVWCHPCSKSVRYEALVDHAMGVHLKAPAFTCRHCSKNYTCFPNMVSHIRLVHNRSIVGGYEDHRPEYEADIKRCLDECYGAKRRHDGKRKLMARKSIGDSGNPGPSKNTGEMSKQRQKRTTKMKKTPGKGQKIGPPFECGHCNWQTSSEAGLRMHLAVYHKEF